MLRLLIIYGIFIHALLPKFTPTILEEKTQLIMELAQDNTKQDDNALLTLKM